MAFATGVASVAILSLLPARSLPSFGISDKLEHFVAYALLALVGGFAFPSQQATTLLFAFLSALAISLEVGQWFVPGRSPETVDAIAGGLGACMALCSHLLLRSRLAIMRRNESFELVADNSTSNSHTPKQTNGR